MINPEVSPPSTSPVQRKLGWVGLWLCAACSLPLLIVWVQSFSPRRPLRLPPVGSDTFWWMLGLDALMASLVVFSQWQESKKPKKRKPVPAPTTPKNRLRPWLAGAALAGFIILRILAANPGASVNWAGVLSGLLAQSVLFYLISVCTKLTQPPSAATAEETEMSAPAPPFPLSLPLGVRPPNNKFRAEVSAREVVYQRPLSAQIAAGVGGLFFVGMGGAAVWITLLSLELISVPGMHMRSNPAMALMMGGGSLFFLSAFIAILATIGPRELRVSPLDQTYIYRVCSPVRWKVLTGWAGKSGGDELGVPWQVVEYQGKINDITGLQRRETTYKSTTYYTLFLCWHDPLRPPMRVGFSTDEAKARALQAQAAEDLGVPLLPDEVV